MQNLFILQGAPGSGKSTVAKILRAGILVNSSNPVPWICSTDDYFGSAENGRYNFDASKLGKAHRWNQDRVKEYLGRGCSVIVDNTSTRCWEAKPYVQAAVELNVPVVFIRCEGEFENIHGVPKEKVRQMRMRMESLSVEGCLHATKK